MNQYPTLFLSLKDVDGTTFENAFNMLKFVISSLCSQNSYLETGENIRENEKDIFSRLRSQTASITDIKGSIVTIMNMMQSYYEKPVILLIDEYDVPIAKASNNGYTGCLKIAKESIFTGTNNFVSDTISSTRYNEYYGFTQQDVDKLLADAEIEEKAELIKEWYDGYNFGEFEVYCPWDVMNYLRDLQNNLNARPVSYWKNTSDNAIIRSFIDYTGAAIRKKLEVLIAGEASARK